MANTQTIMEDRYADSIFMDRPRTNDFRASRGHVDVRVCHQTRQQERKMPLTARWTLAINRWRAERGATTCTS